MTKKTHRQFAFTMTSPCLKQYAFCALLFLFCLLSLKSCSPTEPVFQDHEIHIDIDAEVTESWINLRIDGLEQDAKYIVKRDDSIIFRKRLSKRNKLIHDINLVPGRNYRYKAYAKIENKTSDTTEFSLTTMDSTKSDFNISYQTIKHAQFRHCWIWDQNSYWIIGEYYPVDSTGASMRLHNILTYENGKWSDIAVKYEAGWSSPLSITETSGFWAFDKNNVWFGIYDLIYWNGGIGQIIFDGSQRHILYGFGDNELYAAGRKGQILQIKKNEIHSIDLPENYYISDIWGDKDKNLGLTVFESSTHKRLLLFLKNNEIEEIEYKCLDYPNTLWFKNKNKIFMAGIDINILNRDGSIDVTKFKDMTYITKIRGTDINNIFAITWGGKVFHFNGVRWKLIFRVPATLNDIQVTDDLILIVGSGMINSMVINLTYNNG